MPGRPADSLDGTEIKRGDRTVPFCLYPESMAASGRELVSDPWSYLMNHVETLERPQKATRDLAKAFIRQSREFYGAAENPQMASRPLLYYYSFMNMVKAWIVLDRRTKLQRAYHGVKEHRQNFDRSRLRLTKQRIQIEEQRANSTGIYRELLRLCGGTVRRRTETIGIADVLSQVVGIHRTYAGVSGKAERFLLLREPKLMRCTSPRAGIYVRFEIAKRDLGRGRPLSRLTGSCDAFARARQVRVGDPDAGYAFESSESAIVPCRRVRMRRLEELVRDIRPSVHAVLTRDGLRFYVACCDDCRPLPQLAAIYAVFFYLGSVTRYHPHDFTKVREKKYGWVVDEFLNTQPLQFAYLCASHIAKRDLYLPLCAID